MEENSKTTTKNKLNKTWLLVSFLVILTAVLLVISLTSKNPSSLPFSSKSVKTDFAHTSLVISSEPKPSSISGVYQTDIAIDTKDNTVTGVQLELTFDPKMLTEVDIKQGTFFSNPVVLWKKIDIKTGRISFILGSKLNEKGIKGKGVIATISFVKTSSAPTQINFLPQTLISAGYTQSALQQTTSATIGNLSSGSAQNQNQIFVSPQR